MFHRIVSIAVGVIAAALLLAGHAQAGSANAELRCVSKGKKVTVSGNIPGDFAEFELAFAENGATMTMTNDTKKGGKDRVFVHEDFKNGVFAVAVAMASGHSFTLYGIPRSVRKSAKRTNKRFQAVLQTAPRPSLKEWNYAVDFFSRLPMSCRYKYKI
jgi:hypothetical protein